MEPGARLDDRLASILRAASTLQDAGDQRLLLESVLEGDAGLASGLAETVTLRKPDREAQAPSFAAGELVAGRFEVRRRMGEGGMAVVYEALDRKLGERRALKFPKSGHSHAIPPETRSALRVTHSNICRIHEIHTAATEGGPADFISMEFVDGETLQERWRRAPLPHEEALDIALQLCAGVDAAHSAGVLHRDLKSSNVMLTRSEEATRVVIMDFGLALQADSSHTNPMAGTPAYMAPEQWKGAPPSVATDLYALGLVLYETLTGRLPFAGASWKQRLNELPPPPGASDRHPDPRWDATVLRLLDPDPTRRFASAADVQEALEDAFRPASRRPLWVAAAAMAAILVPAAALRDRIWPPPLARLAILPFTGADSAVQGGLFDLASRLESLGASSQRLAVIPFEESLRYEVNTPAQAASQLRATHTLSGSVAPSGSGLSLRAAVTDLRDGQVVRRFDGEFGARDLTAVPAALAGIVTSAFRMEKAPASELSPEAYPPYAAGLAALRAPSPRTDDAIEAFKAAALIDGSAPAIHGSLAEAYLQKWKATNDAAWLREAAAAARRAENLNPDSPPVLLVAGAIEAAEGRPEKALERFRRAAELEPANPEGWRRSGVALLGIGREDEAVRALRRAIELAPAGHEARLNLGSNFFRRGRYREAAEEYRAVTRLAPDLPVGHAYLGAALLALEKEPEAEAALRTSIRLRETRAALNNLGVLLRYQRRDAEAARVFESAMRAGVDDAGLRLNLANALRAAGRADQARDHYVRASAMARAALLINPRDAAARARLAYSLVQLGDRHIAADEALQAARFSPGDYYVLYWSVMTLEALGRRDEAFPLISGASHQFLRDLRRQPDLAAFGRDPRFLSLLQQQQSNDERNDDAR